MHDGLRRMQAVCLPVLLATMFGLWGASTVQAVSFTSAGNGNWSNTTAWVGGVVPTAGADVTIANGHTVAVSANVTNFPGSLTIDGTLAVGGFSLTNTGATTVNGTLLHTNTAGSHVYIGNVTINNGGNWSETVAVPITFGGNLQNDGTLTSGSGIHTFTGAVKILSGVNAIAISNVTVTGSYQNNGTLTVATLLTVTSPGVLTNNGTINAIISLAGTGGLTQGVGATLNLGGTSAITALNATDNNNTVNYTGAVQTVKGVGYNNLNLAGSGAKTLTSVTNITGNLTLGGSATASLASLTNITGNLTLSGTATATTAANLILGGNLTVGSGTSFILGGFTFTLNGTAYVAGALTNNSATGVKTFIGDVTIPGGGIWSETAATAISFGGSLTNDGVWTASTGIHTFTGTGKSLNGTNAIAIPNTTINGTYQNNGTLTVSTALGGAGTLTQGASSVLNIGGTATNALVATSVGNAVNYTGAVQTVISTSYHHLSLRNNGTKSLVGVTTIGGDLTVSGSAMPTNYPALSIGGVFSYGSSGSLTLTNAVTGGALTLTNGTLNLGTGLTHVIAGNWTRTAGTLLGGSSTLKIGGSVSGSGGAFTAGTSTVEWNAAGDQTLAALTYNHLILSGGSGAKAMDTGSTVTGTLSIATGVKANLGAGANISVGILTLAGVGQDRGTWGSSSAPGATHQNDTFFSPTTGYLTVLNDIRPDTVTWRGTGDWFTNTACWSNGIPGPGSNVWIASGTVNLTNSPPVLNEFTIANGGVVVFSNWTTILTATNIFIQTNGTMTLSSPFTTTQPSNRVYIVCTNLTIEAGGMIDLRGKGYRGTNGTSAHGIGPGMGYYTRGGGAGHGGRGGYYPFDLAGGAVYGSLFNPETPGSSGAAGGNTQGASGGGVGRVVASGTVLVNGSINASGENGLPWTSLQSGCGAGGSIWISCAAFGGDGTVSANGGTGSAYPSGEGSAGGGGRIAINYGALVGTPGVRISVAAGWDGRKFETTRENPSQTLGTTGYGQDARPGTIYLPDTGLLSSTISRLSGYLAISNLTSWSTTDLTVSNTVVGFCNRMDLNVTGNILVTGAGAALTSATGECDVVCSGNIDLQAGGQLLLEGGLNCGGSITAVHSNSVVAVKGNTDLNCAGNLILTNGAAAYFHSGQTNGLGRNYGLLVGVTGDVNLASSSWIYPYSHFSDGGSCLFKMNNLTIPTNAGFNADYKGFHSAYAGSGYGYGRGTYQGGGGGYGGKGGKTSLSGLPGNPYGSTNAPIQPGSGGGAHPNAVAPPPGGGSVRIDAVGNIDLNGLITANGQQGGYYGGVMQGGCGAGGGIFLMAASLTGGADSRIRADGGTATSGASTNGGGGGGGRVSVAVGLSRSDRDKLVLGQAIDGLTTYYSHSPSYLGLLSATNGLGYTNIPPDGAAAGTYQFLKVISASQRSVVIAGEPSTYSTPSPDNYGGSLTVADGTVLTNTVATPANEVSGQRWSCLGWRVNDTTASGALITNDTSTQAVFTVSTNVTLTWLWTNQYQFAVSSSVPSNGSVNDTTVNGFYTNGFVLTGILATASNNYQFSQWTGVGVPAGQDQANPLTVTMSQARTLVANFTKIGGETRIWTGTGNWTSSTNWSPVGIPGIEDQAVISTGTVTISDTRLTGGLIVTNGGIVLFTNWTASLTASNVVVATGGTITVAGPFIDGQMSNRIYVVCTNLTVEPGGQILADYKGYASAFNASGFGPGKGVVIGNIKGGGAGHGGRGGSSSTGYPFSADTGGGVYDSLNAPIQPGSGGAGQDNAGFGGSGGGAIRIQASGTVTVNGNITARGQNGLPWGPLVSGCGSGGAIWINCVTFAGNNGVINADGGTGAGYGPGASGGGGGGGRIAVLYQTLSTPHAVSLSAVSGLGAYVFYTSEAGYESGLGTVYLSDTNFLSSTISNNLAGRLVFANTASWITPNLLVTNTALGFDDNFTLNVTGDLVVAGANTILLTGTNSQTTVGGAVRVQNAGKLELQGHLTSGGNLTLESGTNILAARGNLLLNCGGDFTLTNGSVVYLYNGMTNGLGRNYGILVSVTGSLTIASSSWIYPYSHYSDGGSCLFTMKALTVQTNAGFNADYKGFNGGYAGSGYGPGGGTAVGGGAGYGGKGGRTSSTGSAGNPYGSTNAPLLPGSTGGAQANAGTPPRGGGAIRIVALEKVQLDGSMTANGQQGGFYNGTMQAGCGSGGGIFVMATTFIGSSNSQIKADGGSSYGQSSIGGGGGGGRIALWINIPEAWKTELWNGGLPSKVTATNTYKYYAGVLSVTNGLGYTNAPTGGAEPGTIMVFTAQTDSGVIFSFY
jgi:hypothetical protein